MSSATRVRSMVAMLMLFGAALGRADDASTNRQIENFALHDYRGKLHALEDFNANPLVVVAFVGTECPLAKLYAPRLQELYGKYKDRGVAFLAVDANRQDSLAELAAYARTYGIEFPVLKDAGNKVADQFAAARTPEVFVLDADRKVRYHGRVDDQYGLGAGSGYAKPKVERHDLANALDELLAGGAVKVARHRGQGLHHRTRAQDRRPR